MSIKRFSEGNMDSLAVQAKKNKEAVSRSNDLSKSKTERVEVECGLKNPCVFGAWRGIKNIYP